MPYIKPEDIIRARQIDLLTYLKNYEPQELVRVSGDTYCTREHDSLKISNGMWCWFSRGIGGRSALDYLVKVKGYPFTEAVQALIGREAAGPPCFCLKRSEKGTELKNLLIPACSESTGRVQRYLQGRGIDPEIIRYCIDYKLLFETEQYHNCLFLGYDKDGTVRYGALRGTIGSYKGDLTGSSKRYSFCLAPRGGTEEIHVFEAAIDALSYASLEKLAGRDWKGGTYLSLAGVYQPKRTGAVPAALKRYLDDHPEIKTVRLHLDNDQAGRAASKGIMEGLKGRYRVLDQPPACGKDVNEQLMIQTERIKKREEQGSLVR